MFGVGLIVGAVVGGLVIVGLIAFALAAADDPLDWPDEVPNDEK